MGFNEELTTWMRGRPSLAVMLDVDAKNAPRIHPRRLPQDAGTAPRAIVYHKISDVSENALPGVVALSNARIQFDCFGPTPSKAEQLRERLKKELDAFYQGQMGALRVYGAVHDGDRDDDDEPNDGSEQARFICSCDYLITYQRATT